jgi:hypothetical protein
MFACQVCAAIPDTANLSCTRPRTACGRSSIRWSITKARDAEPTRDALIVALRRKGFTYRQIGKVIGMSAGSVGHALERIAEGRPGRGPRC